MKRYKTIKRLEYVPKWEEVEEKVPVWWYKTLLWIFGYQEEKLDRLLSDERSHAWTDAFAKATKKAHSTKEDAMQKKLAELGYEVRCNFPMARMLNPDEAPTPPFDPAKSWEIVATPSKEDK